MAITAADLRKRDDLLERLRTVWGDLSGEERSAVEVVVNSILLNHGSVEGIRFRPLGEREIPERIDRSLAEADAGDPVASEDFERELVKEFGLS